jgi:hypothetical protein
VTGFGHCYFEKVTLCNNSVRFKNLEIFVQMYKYFSTSLSQNSSKSQNMDLEKMSNLRSYDYQSLKMLELFTCKKKTLRDFEEFFST